MTLNTPENQDKLAAATDADRYTAEIGGEAWSKGPIAKFATVKACREWAEEYGTTAEFARIYETATGKLVAVHRRTLSDGWFAADITGEG